MFSLRRKQTPLCFPLTEIHYDVDEAFQFYYRCLQFFWTHPETMQCFVVETKSTFLEAWLVLQVYRNSNGVTNYKDDFIPMLLKVFFSHFVWFTHQQQLHTCCPGCCLQPFNFLFYEFIFLSELFNLPSHHKIQLLSLFLTRQSAPLHSHQIRLSSR